MIHLRVVSVLLIYIVANSLFAQGTECAGDFPATPICSIQGLTFANCYDGGEGCKSTTETLADYGCLGATPFPSWHYLRIATPGDLLIRISQSTQENGFGSAIDVDFIAYGPFDDPVTPCSGQLTEDKIVDCSFLTDSVEVFSILEAQEGAYYIIMITNFSGAQGYISVTQYGGSGATDCSILAAALGGDQEICGRGSYLIEGETNGAVRYEWSVFNEATGLFELIEGETSENYTVTTSGKYQLLVEDEDGETDTSAVEILFYDVPVFEDTPNDLSTCSTQLNKGIFDLSSNSSVILGGQDPDFYEVRYYVTMDDFDNNMPIAEDQLNSFETNVNSQQIVAGVLHKKIECRSGSAIFTLYKEALPTLFDNEAFLGEKTVCTSPDGLLNTPLVLGEDLGLKDGQDYLYDWTPDNIDSDNDGREDALWEINRLTATTIFNLKITRLNSFGRGQDCSNEINPISEEPYSISIIPSAPPSAVNYTVIDGRLEISPVMESGTLADLTYSIDGLEFQEYTVFTDLSPGDYTVTVRNINGCKPDAVLAVVTVPVYNYPKFFTPNGDGFYDVWSWKFTDIGGQSGAVLSIFDRFGKLIKTMAANNDHWDGTYNGEPLPATDYWFVLDYVNPNTGKKEKMRSNFSLIR